MTGSDAPRLPIPAKIILAALAALAGALAAHLWPEWSLDPDLSHGFLMPVICVLLLWLGRNPPGDALLGRGRSTILAATLGTAALCSLWAAGLLAATLDWASPVVDFLLACAFGFLGCAAIAAFADRRVGLVGFNWGTVCAAALWPLCAPLPPGTYSRLTLALQLWVSSGVMHALGILGVAAYRKGNIIELARGTVGIEEACSGVRSLISCIFVGFLLSATLVRRPWARVLIIALSAPLALLMNFLRSLLLTLLVNGGVRVEGLWHDATGYAVLLATAAILVGMATALGKAAPAARGDPAPTGGAAPWTGALGALAAVLAMIGATLAFFAADTPSPYGKGGPSPDLLSMLPDSVPGWRVETTPGLYRFAGTLRTENLAQRTYYLQDAAGTEQVTIYAAFWPAGHASVGLVSSHTPDACWPGSGWVARDVPDSRVALGLGARQLPVAQHRLFVNEGYPQHVWFWQLHDGRVVEVGSPRSVGALIRIGLRYGFRRPGSEAFVRISGNRPWDEVRKAPFIAEFFERARPLGLY